MLFPEASYNCIALTKCACILSRWDFYSEERKQKLLLSSSPTRVSASLTILIFVIFFNFNTTKNPEILSWFIPLVKCVFVFKKEFFNIFFISSPFGSFVSLVGNCQKCPIRHPLQVISITHSLQGSLNAMQILSLRSKKQVWRD